MLKKLICLFCGLFLLITPTMGLAAAEPQPPVGALCQYLDDMPFWQYWFFDAEASILLPINSGVEVMEDGKNRKSIFIACKDFGDTLFTFTLTKDQSLDGLTLLTAPQKTLDAIIASVCGEEKLVGKLDPYELTPEMVCMRTRQERDGYYTDHLVSIQNGWLVDMTAQPTAKNQVISTDVNTFQNTIVYTLFVEKFPRMAEYSLPGTAFSASVPQKNCYLVLDYDEDDYKTLYLMTPEKQTIAVNISLIKDPAYADKTIESLDEETRQALYSMCKIDESDEFDIQSETLDGCVVHHLTRKSDPSVWQHDIALKDGWAMIAYSITYKDVPQKELDWILSTRDALIRRFLGEDVELPVLQ